MMTGALYHGATKVGAADAMHFGRRVTIGCLAVNRSVWLKGNNCTLANVNLHLL